MPTIRSRTPGADTTRLFLDPATRQDDEDEEHSEHDGTIKERLWSFRTITASSVVYLPAILLFLSEASELLLVSPRIRLLEASICRKYYQSVDPSAINPDGSVEERLCKVEEVQTRLAHIRGWQVFWEAIPVMALAVPWGMLADRSGRKKVLAANFLGNIVYIIWFLIVCNPSSKLPVEAVWAASMAYLLGGGPRTGGILILALVTDASPSAKRSERFYYTYSAFLLTELIAPPLAAAMMSRAVELPFAVAIIALMCAFIVLYFVKEIHHKSIIDTSEARAQEEPEDSEAARGLLTPALAEEGYHSTKETMSLRGIVHHIHKTFKEGYDTNILFVLIGHFLCPVRQELLFQITIPYVSKLFSIEISKAGLLLSIVAITNLIIFITFLPFLARILRVRYGFPAQRIDKFTAQLSSIVLALGCIAMGYSVSFSVFAAATVVFAAGFGIRLSLLSLLTSLVDRTKVARVYTLVTVVEGFGEMVSAPVLQEGWAIGLRKGGGWVALPWWTGAVAYAIALLLISRVRIRPT